MNLWLWLRKKFVKLIMSLTVINKWWRCKRYAPWINNCDWREVQKGSNVTNGNQQILWIIDSIEHLLFQSRLCHVLPLFSNVRKTSYTPSSHVTLVQRHGWDLNNIWISLKSDISFSKIDFLFFSLFGFHLISFFPTFRNLIKYM